MRPLGITTVVINYSLCPKVSPDEVTRQSRAALAWVPHNIERHGRDPRRVALGGHSVGGHLTALCLQTLWREEHGMATDPLAAAMLVSGIYDLEPLRYLHLQPQIQLDGGIIRRNSPQSAIRRCATPALITLGAAESPEFARQSQTFHDAWREAGHRSELIAQPGAHHCTAIHGFEDSRSQLCQWLAAALFGAEHFAECGSKRCIALQDLDRPRGLACLD